MEVCQLCGYVPTSRTALDPVGSENPDYYIIGDIANSLEIDSFSAYPETSPDGQLLMATLKSIGIDYSRVRKSKVVRCTFNHEIHESIRYTCLKYTLMDILETRPKVIITLGKEVSSRILRDKFTSISRNRGRLHDIDIGGEKFKVLPTYSPNYVVNNPSANEIFFKDLLFAKSYIDGDLVDIADKELLFALDYASFKDYYINRALESELLAYDLEANAKDSRSQDAKMVGFSIAPDGNSGLYVVRTSLEYKMPESEWNQVVKMLKMIIETRRLLVHNSMYEIPFTLNELGIRIQNFEDTLAKLRLILGGKTGAGLKDQCQSNLGYPDWDKDLSIYRDNFMNLLSKLRPTPSGNDRWDFVILRDGGLLNLIDVYESSTGLGDREASAMNSAVALRDVIAKEYQSDEEFSIIVELLSDELVSLIESNYQGEFSYGFIPLKIITKYGAMDSVGTQDINRYADEKMRVLSDEMGIDLQKGYGYIKYQFLAGISMELNGLHWDNEVAEEELAWYRNECLKAAKYLINSQFTDDFLVMRNSYVLNDYFVDNMMHMVRDIYGELKFYKKYFIIAATGKKVGYKKVLELLGKDFIAQHSDLILQIVRDSARNMDKYEDLKMYFNPASPIQAYKDLLNEVLITPEIKVAHLMAKLNFMIDDPKFRMESYPISDRRLFQILIDCRSFNSMVDKEDIDDKEIIENLTMFDEFEDELDGVSVENSENGEVSRTRIKMSNHDTFEKFVKVFSETQIMSHELQMLAGSSLNYSIDGTSEGTIIELFSYYSVVEKDINDPKTWSERFEFLYNYRVWKKCNKIITTYINGAKVGRGSVWIVDKEDYQSGSELTRRKTGYYTRPKNEKEMYLLQTSYGVNTAETLRWRSGIHTIPAESSVKNIYTSRYYGGSMAAPDFSQMEVRAIAGLSKCTPMLEAFKQGADIHLQNASKIWRKPPEEISPAERRYSKMATFQILYGGSPYNFGMEFLGGDVNLAQEIYDSFYAAFPEIKIWIEERHREMEETGRVTIGTTNMFLNVTPDQFGGDPNKAYRAAQNYPVQSSGSNMAGFVLYKIDEYIKEHQMLSKICMFVHDSLEVDVHPMELIQVGSQIIPLMNKFPMDEFGIPTAADLILGKSIGQELEIPKFEASDDMNEAIIVMEGFQDNFELLINSWNKVYKMVEWKDLVDPKTKQMPTSDLFVPKKAINRFYGQQRVTIKREVKIKIA